MFGGCEDIAHVNIDECIAESIVRNTNDLVTLAALDCVNKLFHSFVSIKLKTLRSQLCVKWLTERLESVDGCDWIAAQQGIQVCVIGASGTGKTCIAERLVGKDFPEKTDPTIGAGFQIGMAPVRGRGVKMGIWDTSGRERYRPMLRMYCRKRAAILLVYDITCLASLNSLAGLITEIRDLNYFGKFLLCGNKADIVDRINQVQHGFTGHGTLDTEAAVTYAQGLAFARANHCDGFVEVSAKTMKNMPQLLAAFGLLALEGAPPAEDKTYPLGRVNKKKETGCVLA
ncbi:RAB4B, member RAS oncogene family [Pelomyxa schiedti]|nr:RAB4B, member RAS oncogene family [Pelomyxa schiedti]